MKLRFKYRRYISTMHRSSNSSERKNSANHASPYQNRITCSSILIFIIDFFTERSFDVQALPASNKSILCFKFSDSLFASCWRTFVTLVLYRIRFKFMLLCVALSYRSNLFISHKKICIRKTTRRNMVFCTILNHISVTSTNIDQ